jgi:CMP-N,N'-diacetyllegionaminic acid synthase
MATLALIPARGGSKGIPRKNVRSIAGKPLIAWTIEAARAVRGIDAVIVSTEDAEIAAVARDAGADVPFMRPPELAADDTPGIAPVLHALAAMPQFDSVILLQPTSPLRGMEDIEGVLALAEARQASSVVSVCEVSEHPAWMYRIGSAGGLKPLLDGQQAVRRQDLPPVYTLNGAIYFAHTSWLMTQRGFIGPDTLGYPMTGENSVDIDGPLDWRLAELLLADRMRPA